MGMRSVVGVFDKIKLCISLSSSVPELLQTPLSVLFVQTNLCDLWALRVNV